MQGRIIKGIGGMYTVDTTTGQYLAKPRGIFRLQEVSPVVGDLVDISILEDEDNNAVIEHIHERSNYLIRPKVANVDQALVVFSIKDPKINVDLLDKFIIFCEVNSVEPIICINKIDKSTIEEQEQLKDLYESIGYKIIFTSVKESLGLAELHNQLINKVSVFAGPSGVGKSSICNFLMPELGFKTGELSKKISRGKHTTRESNLIKYAESSYIVDTPGFSNISIDMVEKNDLKNYFREFLTFSPKCKFANCIHISEPGCAVKMAVSEGFIRSSRYDRYFKIYNS